MSGRELDLTVLDAQGACAVDDIQDAVDLASDQDQVTWLTDGGKRVAAIVPVEAAELYEARFRGLPYPAAADSSLLEWARRIVRENPPPDPS